MCIVPIPYPLEGALGICVDGDSHIAAVDKGPGIGLYSFDENDQLLGPTPARSIVCRNCKCFWQEPVKEDPRWPRKS